MDRLAALQHWVQSQFPHQSIDFSPASADASFRRYFRARLDDVSYIVMDAPPEHENCRPFIDIARLFKDAGANVPEILAEDLDQGFLLLSDLGDITYLQALNDESADSLYRDAIATLIDIQLASRAGVLPEYDAPSLMREMRLFPDWYITRELGLDAAAFSEIDAHLELINRACLAQPKVYVHRDYHSRNLMVERERNPGVLDFQDAVYGPITYDLVSLFKDAYIAWDEERVLDWVVRYWERARKARLPVHDDFGEFYRAFEWMGVQRHLKVLGIFARLYHRDGKAGYLKDMPLVMRYLRSALERYAELAGLLALLDRLEASCAERRAT